jgi:hypothetical protein
LGFLVWLEWAGAPKRGQRDKEREADMRTLKPANAWNKKTNNNNTHKHEEDAALQMFMYVPETVGLCQSHQQAFQKL